MVRQLELAIQQLLKVQNAVAVSTCTNGLMLALQARGIKGKVILPSFTFFATAHSVAWNNLEPVFVDIDPGTWTLATDSVEAALENGGIGAVIPVHVFGNPCDVERLAQLAGEANTFLLYDAAHAMGSKFGGKHIGCFGDAEVFSLTPTKMVTAAEGGMFTTRDAELADRIKIGRDYGNSGDYDPEFIGLSARMSEFHAVLGVESLRLLQLNVRRRNELAKKYKSLLESLPGISFQLVREGNVSTYKDFTIRIEEENFGIDRDALAWFLQGQGIDTRKYFYPPVHRTKPYWERWGKLYDDSLDVTNHLSRQVISLPMWSHMESALIDRICGQVADAHEKAEEIKLSYQRATEDTWQ